LNLLAAYGLQLEYRFWLYSRCTFEFEV